MRAMQLRDLGQPLVMSDVPMPQPGPGEVLIRLAACGLNFGDTLIVKGTYQEKPERPATIGMEVSLSLIHI